MTASSDILAGSSHAAWDYVKANWRGLLRVSAVPLVIAVGLIGGYVVMVFAVVTAIIEAMASDGGKPPVELIRSFLVIELVGMLGMIVAMLAASWLSVKVVRFRRLGEDVVVGLNKAAVVASLFWLVYLIGIEMLVMLGSLAVLIPSMLVMGIAGAMVATSGSPIAGAIVMGLLGVVVLSVWLLAITGGILRFASGLPPVAWGQTPDFFKDMWARSKGLTWALTWRASVPFAVYMLVAVIVVLGSIAGDIWQLWAAIEANPDTAGDAILKGPVLTDMITHMLLGELAVIVAGVPLLWWMLVWLVEVYERIDRRATSA